MPGCKLPPETIAEIKALRAKGHSISEIQALAKVRGRGTVSRHIQGIKLPNGPLKSGKRWLVARNVCRDLKNQGLSIRAIAARLGCGATAVHRAIHS
ncbi:hypothetical protein [Microvirga zambiensis]|uniref:hypothetical protein n=1 Tax=Microvirga zambiensis TaxID=1402137 RepID=UPI00191E0254|nr:hypothetical protein [Microvirga zambiensis]